MCESDRSSQASEASTSDLNERGCELCGSASRTITASESSLDIGRESRATPTSPSFEGQTLSQSMSFAAGSRARTYRTQGSELASTGSEADSGVSSSDSLASYDPSTSWWKTSQPSLFEDSMLSSLTLPPQGSMQSGRLYERPISALRTPGTASGLWPTPRAAMGDHGISWSRAMTGNHRSQLEDYLASLVLQAGGHAISGSLPNHHLVCWMMGFPKDWLE